MARMDGLKNAQAIAVFALFDRLFPLWGVCAFPQGVEAPSKRFGEPPPAGAKAVLMAAFPYLLPEELYAGRNISRYAVVRDYHVACGERLAEACCTLEALFPGEEFGWYCDNSPLPEVTLAEAAGIGRRGRHNLLITESYGSWVVLGEIVSTVSLPQNDRNILPAPCGGCRLCVTACPSGALAGGEFDRSRCLSRLSQKKGELTAEEQALLRKGASVWGCDICQEACPRNVASAPAPLPEFLVDPLPRLRQGASLEGRAYAWRGADVLARNLRICAGETEQTLN